MTHTKQRPRLDAKAPVEIWLRQDNLEVTATVVFEDESTTALDVYSLSMRAAQREITGYLISLGYAPMRRWATETGESGESYTETMRQFRPRKSEAA